MSIDLTATSSATYRFLHREPVDVSVNISTMLDAKSYAGTIELKDGNVKVSTKTGDSATASVNGAPPIVIAVDLLKVLLDNQHTWPKTAHAGASSYDVG